MNATRMKQEKNKHRRSARMQIFLFAFLLMNVNQGMSQSSLWSMVADSISNLSSPRAQDLNLDGVKDIVFGGAADALSSHNGIVAVDGSSGQMLWRTPARNEVFGSAIFRDITGDNIPDVFIGGRQAQLLALDGSNGMLIWDFFPYSVNPADSGWYNFYNPQFIPDQNNDGTPDLLVANGGDHSAPVWDTLRPAGKLLIINTLDGSIISEAVVPDSAEIYCSPVVLDLQGDGVLWVLYGTGGETLGGHFYACPLSHLATGSLSQSIALATDADLGFIAPASYCKGLNGETRVYIQGFGGSIYCINGSTLSSEWIYTKPNTESSSALVIGNFTGNFEPDVFAVLYKGSGTSYTDYYQIMLDGASGTPVFTDSIGTLHFASANACDFNNDGRDEVLISVSENNGGIFRNKLYTLDFVNQQIQQTGASVSGVNLASTPLIEDLDGDNHLEVIFMTKVDSLNPSGVKGVRMSAIGLTSIQPISGIAWGSYMGSKFNGAYQYRPNDCGTGSVSNSAAIVAPSCNGLSDGSISPVVSSSASPFTFVWGTGSTDSVLTGIPAGTYTVRITNKIGCYEELQYVLPEPYIISFGGILSPTCPGDSNGTAILNSTGCVCQFNTCTFLWDNGVTTKANSSLPEGWSFVTINHPGGCVVTDSVFVPASPSLIDSISIQAPTCYGDSNAVVDLQGNPAYAPHTITWWNGSVGNSISNLSAGVYPLVIQDLRGCIDSLAVTITDPSPLSLSASSQNLLCYQSNDGEISLLVNGGVQPYTLTINGAPAGQSNVNLAAGSYQIVLTDSAGCVKDTSGVLVTEPDAIAVSFTISPEQGAGTLSGFAIAHVTGGTPPYTFMWNDPAQQTDSSAVYLSTGWYVLEVSDSNACLRSDSVFIPILLSIEDKLDIHNSFFPNPTQGSIQFREVVDLVRVVQPSGQVVKEFSTAKRIDLADLSDGLYFIETRQKGQTTRKPLIKVGQ